VKIPRFGEDDANPRPPAPEQIAAYKFLKEHQAEVTEAILAALLKVYTELRPRWLEQCPDSEDLPEIRSVDEMRQHVGVGTLHMYEIAKEGCAYIGAWSWAALGMEETGPGSSCIAGASLN
jgi:hypothetical protein